MRIILLTFMIILIIACGRMQIKENHYYAVTVGENTNYYRLNINADTILGDAEYRSGWFPARSVDSLFGEVTQENGAKTLEARGEIEQKYREKIVAVTQQYLEKASDPDISDETLDKYLNARRRVLAYPRWQARPLPGTIEIEYNPMKGVAILHADEKLVFVLSSDPDEVVSKIVNFSESDKTVFSINQFAKITAQRVRNQIAAQEAEEEVNKRIDGIIHDQIKKTLTAIDDKQPANKNLVISEIDTLLRLLESVP